MICILYIFIIFYHIEIYCKYLGMVPWFFRDLSFGSQDFNLNEAMAHQSGAVDVTLETWPLGMKGKTAFLFKKTPQVFRVPNICVYHS